MATTNYEITPTGTDQFSSTEGTITMDTTNPVVGTASFLFGAGGTANIDYADKGGVADAGNGHIVEWAFKADDTVPGAAEAFDFYRHSTLDPFSNLAFGFDTDGTMYVKDDAGTVQGTGSTVLTPDTWYTFAFYFEVATGTGGKLGPVYLDGVEEIAQVTGLDTFDAAAPHQDRFLHNTFGTPPPQNTFNLGWYRHISGATGIGDRLGPPATFAAAVDLPVGLASQMMVMNRLSRKIRKKRFG